MKLWKHALCMAAAGAFAWPMASVTALAEKGDRGGGDRGGQRSSDGNRGERRGGDGDRGQSSFSGGGQQRGQAQRSEGQRRSADSMQNRQREQQQSAERQLNGESGRTSARSFYRGQDGSNFDRGDFNRQQSDRSEDRSNRGQYNRDGRNPSLFDQLEGRDRGDSNRNRDRDEARERDRDRDRDREFTRDRDNVDRDERNSDRDRRNRYDRDRDRDNTWNRFGRDDWRNRTYDIQRNWRGWYGGGGNVPFRGGWYDNYIGSNWPVYSPYRYSRWSNRPYYWWGWTPAAQLTDWVVFGWDRPRYWAYGPNANIYYRDNYVYYDGRQKYAVDDYYQQIYDLAHNVPKISEQEAEKMDWRPLGVFAVASEGQSQSERALQLAVNREGVLTGTYFNRENGHVHPISGMVDDQTQRAAWAFADGEHEDVVFETSIYNLTRPESTMMVHFGPGADETEVWQLVRLEQPDSNATSRDTTQRPTSSRSLP